MSEKPPSYPFRESFSRHNPKLQLAWDSVSSGSLKFCPRFYELSIIEGYEPFETNIHLKFGILYHKGTETYGKALASGHSHEYAAGLAVSETLVSTWDKGLRRPWFSDNSTKNRGTLIRTIAWYLDQFRDDPLQTIILPNGTPFIEMPFRFETGYNCDLTDEPYLFCGRIDRGVMFQDQPWITDKKTSKNYLTPAFFAKFTPDNQISTYSYAGQHILGMPIGGIIIDAAQVQVKSTTFQRGFVTRSPEQLEEWNRDTWYKIKENEKYVQDNYWPMNDRVCGVSHTDPKTGEIRYDCIFRNICRAEPSIRQELLNSSFRKRIWDPLKLSQSETEGTGTGTGTSPSSFQESPTDE